MNQEAENVTINYSSGMLWRIAEKLKLRQRKGTLLSLGAMTGGQTLTVVLSLLSGVLQARFLGPDVTGYFAEFAILGGYLTFLHLGTLTTLQRDYPYWLGKGDVAQARDVAALVQGWCLLIGAATAILYCVLTAISLVQRDLSAVAGWSTQLIIVSFSYYGLYLGCTYRTSLEFITFSKITVANSVLNLLCLPIVIVLGFWGLCLRGAFATLVNAYMLHWARPLHMEPRFSWQRLWPLIKFGLAVDTPNFLGNACVGATMSYLIAAKYGTVVLGLFTFARIAETVFTQLSLSLVQVFVPRISHQMGVTESIRHCMLSTIKPLLFCLAVVAPSTILASLICKPVVAILTPKYIEGVSIMQVFMWMGILSVLWLPGHVLIAARKTRLLAVSAISRFLSFCIIGGFAMMTDSSPIVIAWGYLASRIVGTLILWIFMLPLLWREGK